MTDDHQFEDRLRSTFQAEATALSDRPAPLAGAGKTAPIAALVGEPEIETPAQGSRFALALVAAAILLLGGIAGIVALGGSGGDTFVASRAGSQPLITATPTPVPTTPMLSFPGPSDVIEEPFIHVVQAGDLLGGIAERYGVSVEAILRANPDLDPNVLFVGDELWISAQGTAGERYVPPTPLPAQPNTEVLPTPDLDRVGTAVAAPFRDLPIVMACVTRDVGWIDAGTCGIEVIGSGVGSQIPVQFIDGGGRVTAGFVPVDALRVGEAVESPIYQPGLLEDSWCVTDIFAPDTLNVRQGPSTDRQIVGELTEGQCRIYRTAAGDVPFPGWAPISVDQPGGVPLRGWVADAYLRRDVAYVDPGTPMQTISVRVDVVAPGLDAPTVDAFEFRDGATTLGRPDAAGVIEIPAAVEPVGLLASAPVEGDEFCAWTGRLEAIDSAGFHVLEVALLCA